MDSRPVAPKPFAIFPRLGTGFASMFPAGSDRFLIHHVSRLNCTVEMDGHWEAVARELRHDDPSVALLAARLFSTGTETAREMALAAMHETLTDLAYAREQSEEDPWKALTPEARSPLNKNTLLLAWSAGSVLDELGEPMAGDHWEALKRFQRTDRRVSGDSDQDRSGAGWRRYWRGVAILHLTGTTENWDEEPVPPMLRAAVAEFINWAGHQPDAGSVIRNVRERRTLDPGTLDAVAQAKVGVLGALGDGVL